MTRPPTSPTAGNVLLDQRLARAQAIERDQQLDRRCPPIEARSGLRYRVDNHLVTSFCSNDYLGFADELGPSLQARSGSGASRLVCGDLPEHRMMERRFAEFLELEDAVLFPSGFQANVGVPACILQTTDVAHSDELNHASMIDGLRLAAATRSIIPHLARPPARVADPHGLSWWFTESVFSMDGDGPTRRDLDAHLAEGGCVYLDEAHAIGLGPSGRGRAAELVHTPTLIVAPLGKAFGCAGAFVAGSRQVCEWIRGHARAFVFTTGATPALIPRIAHALARVSSNEGEDRRARLWANVERLRVALRLGPREPDAPSSPIIPLIVGPNAAALELSHALLERGWHVQAIRPPTVPEGRARLRITVSAAHDPSELDRFAADLHACVAALELPPIGAHQARPDAVHEGAA